MRTQYYLDQARNWMSRRGIDQRVLVVVGLGLAALGILAWEEPVPLLAYRR